MYLEELFGLNGKVILVTGGSKGIGKAVSLGLAKAGADIAVFSRNGADETVQAVEAAGRKARSYIVDVLEQRYDRHDRGGIPSDHRHQSGGRIHRCPHSRRRDAGAGHKGLHSQQRLHVGTYCQ